MGSDTSPSVVVVMVMGGGDRVDTEVSTPRSVYRTGYAALVTVTGGREVAVAAT